jgi:hypothetical protein
MKKLIYFQTPLGILEPPDDLPPVLFTSRDEIDTRSANYPLIQMYQRLLVQWHGEQVVAGNRPTQGPSFIELIRGQ